MVVGRRPALVALVTVSAAVALALGVPTRGCSETDSSPEGAVRAFVTAARAADRRAVWDLLGPATRARAEVAAQAATEKVGGARRFAPVDMIDVAVPESTYVPTRIVVREQTGEHAIVDVLGPDDRRDTVTTVRVANRWKVELDF